MSRFETIDQVIEFLSAWASEPDYGDQLALPETEDTTDFDMLAANAPPAYPGEDL